MKVVDKEQCWVCNIVPGFSNVAQIAALPKEQRDWLCKVHFDEAHKPNPFLIMVPKKD